MGHQKALPLCLEESSTCDSLRNISVESVKLVELTYNDIRGEHKIYTMMVVNPNSS